MKDGRLNFSNGHHCLSCFINKIIVIVLSFFSIIIFTGYAAFVYADIATDGTVGAPQTLTGPDFTIPESLGTLSGQNLFHSFKTFSISENQSATFTGSNSINNVISRVTGGEASTIDGLLRSTVGDADFFFINPSGVVFGPHATVDVPAAFHVSTADELIFDDGTVFSASSPATSTLTQAAPESFGFLGAKAATIEINGSVLEFAPESRISLSSGNITIQGAEEQNSKLVNEGGDIQLTALGKSSGNVSIEGDIAGIANGTVSIKSATIDSSGNGGGHIKIHTGKVEFDESSIKAHNLGVKNGDIGVEVSAEKEVIIDNNSSILSYSYSTGNSGDIIINAENLSIDGGDSYSVISSQAKSNSEGNAGTIEINVNSLIQINKGSQIWSTTSSKGDAGNVIVKADKLTIDEQGSDQVTVIASTAGSNSEGNAGTVDIKVYGLMQIINGASISSYTESKGNAGNLIINAGDLTIDRQMSDSFTGIASHARTGSYGNAGSIEVNVADMLKILNGSEISSSIWSQGDAGNLLVRAGQLTIDGQGRESFAGITSQARSGSQGNPGSIEVNVEDKIELIDGGTISSDTFTKADSGDVIVTAENLMIDNKNQTISGRRFTGIRSWTYDEGNAGTVNIIINDSTELYHGGAISSSTFGKGNGNTVMLESGNMKIDAQGFQTQLTGVACQAETDPSGYVSEGDGGEIIINIKGLLEMSNGAQISTSTFSEGNAGKVTVNADKLIIDPQNETYLFTGITSAAYEGSNGNAGDVIVNAKEIQMMKGAAQISSETYKNTTGDAGTVTVSTDALLEMRDGAEISSSTSAKGDAGDVIVTAGSIKINGNGEVTGIESDASYGSSGNAGTVDVTVDGLLELLDEARISSSTSAKGDAKNVIVKAGELKIDGKGGDGTGIASLAFYFSEGNGGTVTVTVDRLLKLIDGALISSSTYAKGDAGTVTVNADNIIIDGESTGIYSAATDNAAGYVGDVIINADSVTLMNGGNISISAEQKLSEESLAELSGNSIVNSININARNIHLDQKATITSESTQNVPASEINIQANKTIVKNSSTINTSCKNADGGDITIQSDSLFIHDAQITTSVEGETGDGGNITIKGIKQEDNAMPENFLVMKGGFIQANTAAENATGGTIDINVNGIITDRTQELEIGGLERRIFEPGQNLNVIQAAAPKGNPGEIPQKLTEIDISGSIANMGVQFTSPVMMSTDPCLALGSHQASSLIQGGKGGFPEQPEDPSLVLLTMERIDETVAD
ncbi:exported hypothetical protein [Desulfamplus magnetovallimortis]|uniref:Filamentous haemagglutinin FhaB/tRNA nuclease CdiA-like TPS domain-containing protein n=1 Tax=Desulfamplus magnetovallimortis TaxID=1246637 RepID=A0A1W1HHA8_9BACT|nr:filamentous hemagglutinin N-terminal domain-containing protein [Desulfamplus magnetovallimortis]SLM31864.1 exported hypothetical protein [Desulfamplus magnetovallimortis]